LWWLLRRESPNVLLTLVALCGFSLAIRLVCTTEFPAGLNEDEPKILWSAIQSLRAGAIWDEGRTGMPVLLNSLFQAQLVPLVGPSRWAIRLYSLATSVLSSPAAFALGRGAGLAVGASFAVAGFVAVLPWSLFYGRIAIGGELVFHELLLLGALARLLFADGGWAAVSVGAFGQSLLLYDYFCGRLIAPIAVVAALLARGRQRWMCLLVPILALLSWVPHLRTNPTNATRGVLVDLIHTGFTTHPLQTLWERTVMTLKVFVYPAALDGWLTVRAAAVHPPVVLLLAGLALLIAVWRFRLVSFVVAGFLIGIAPAVVTGSVFPSAHRMLMAFPFVALAAGIALDAVPWFRLRTVTVWLVLAIVSVQSLRLYFSPAFWAPATRATFDWETTALVDAIPLPAEGRLVVMSQVGYFFDPRAQIDRNYEYLAVENWFPQGSVPSTYAFAAQAALLRPFYEGLLGPHRVESFGRAFLVRFERRDWDWLRQHGWSYEARCGDAVAKGTVPTLFQPSLDFREIHCGGPITVTWRGRWLGPAAQLRLLFSGSAVVETSGQRILERAGEQTGAAFSVQPDTPISVSVTARQPLWAGLLELSPAGERIPPWERVSPLNNP